MIPSQMLKGTLEGCILIVIGEEQIYGYQISERLKSYGFSEISEGTIYPMLLRLEKNKKIDAELIASPTGPKRKYYHLATEGKAEVEDFKKNWKELQAAVNSIIGGKNHES